jgi:RsiW-degrading membrane proteinase PrsW (M82 family)
MRDVLAVRTPLDGVIIGFASGAGFIFLETFFQYVPDTIAKAIEATKVPTAGLLSGLLLMIFRVVGGLGGHMAWAAIGGYFVGLVAARRVGWHLLPVVWIGLAAVHGLFDTVLSYEWWGYQVLGVISGLVILLASFIYFLFCLLKALQLEPELSVSAPSAFAVAAR